MDKVQGGSGRYHNEYRFAGVDAGWQVVVPRIHISREDRYAMQVEIAELRRLLAENGVNVTTQLSEEVVVERDDLGYSSIDQRDTLSTRTDVHVTKNVSPKLASVDEEATRIEEALQDRWYIIGPSWKKGFGGALAWYLKNRPQFWEQLAAVEKESARPLDEENSTPLVADQEDEVGRWVDANSHRMEWRYPEAGKAAYRRDPVRFRLDREMYEKRWSPRFTCSHCKSPIFDDGVVRWCSRCDLANPDDSSSCWICGDCTPEACDGPDLGPWMDGGRPDADPS